MAGCIKQNSAGVSPLNNLDGITDNLLTKPTGLEGQEVLQDKGRITMNLSNYSRGEENTKEVLSFSAESPTSGMEVVELLV